MQNTLFRFAAGGITVLTFVVAGCNYNVTQGPNGPTPPLSEMSLDQVDAHLVFASVIVPKCLGCHASASGNQGGTNLETYSNVRGLLNRISVRALDKKDMPPRKSLSENEIKILRTWIDMGAPETVAGPSQKPDPTLDQGPTDWAKISTKIFRPKCLDCHSGEAPQGGLDLASIATVRAKAMVVFDRVIVKQNMPSEPYPVLSPRERRVLMQWFDAGMPD